MAKRVKKVKRISYDMVPVGLYYVQFNPILSSPCNPGKHDDCVDHGCMDNEPNRISEIDPVIIRVTEKNYDTFSVDVRDRDVTWNDDYVSGDTHDIRPRLFATLKQAKDHASYTLERWKNPQPWESFVKLK